MGVPEGAIAIDPSVLMFGQRQLRGSSQDERSGGDAVHISRV